MNAMRSANQQSNLKESDPIALAATVAERVEIRDVRLVRASCFQSPGAGGIKKFMSDLVRRTESQIDESKKIIAIVAHFEFSAKDANIDSESKLDLHVAADFVLLYRINDLQGLTEPHFRQFGDINGVYNAWPYWREYLHSTIARMGLQAPLLPVFRIASAATADPSPAPANYPIRI